MDWYAWLSKSGLEPSLAYDYSLLFTHNELGEGDVAHFDHQFLLSMGISIAKHRLDILKLAARKSKGPPHPVARLVSAVGRTKKCLARYMSMLRRNKRTVLLKHGRLMITDGGVMTRDPALHGTANRPMAAGGEEEEIGWDSMFQDLKPT